jgi:RUN and FYVE domain-containing protein 1
MDFQSLKLAETEASRFESREMELNVSSLDPTLESELEQKLGSELVRMKQMEKELLLERQMKAECEIAMKLMEKDIHEKQDTIISLRSQLEDIKAINLEMYTKLAECKKTIEVKTGLINTLEVKTVGLLETMQELDDKFVESEQNLVTARSRLRELDSSLQETSAGSTELEQDVKIEREWRERLQESSMTDRDTIAGLRKENEFLKQVSNDYENIRQENQRVKEMNREQDKTLEELGQQLSWTKLQMDSLKEETKVPGSWEKDSEAASCKGCDKEFNIARRKHHCRNCGGIFCDKCSDNKMELPSSAKKLRVCDGCYVLLLDRQSKL